MSLYVHIPVCPQRCDYCDFYSETGTPPPTVRRLIETICDEIETWFKALGTTEVATVYIGGGSPTSIGAEPLALLLQGIERILPPTGSVREWTVESHPGDLEDDILSVLLSSEVSRLSLGVQSFHEGLRRLIGRRGAPAALQTGLDAVRQRWSRALSIDLIGEIPSERAEEFGEDLARAVATGADHISIYPLGWPGTAERRWNTPERPDPRTLADEAQFDCWRMAEAFLEGEGYLRYEVSSFARKGRECRHSLVYWHMHPYLGVGPGAVGTLPFVASRRTEESWSMRTEVPASVAGYLGMDPSLAIRSRGEGVSKGEALFERLMMGLRLLEGVSINAVALEFGKGAAGRILELIREPMGRGHIERFETGRDDRIRYTPSGINYLDTTLRDLLEIKD